MSGTSTAAFPGSPTIQADALAVNQKTAFRSGVPDVNTASILEKLRFGSNEDKSAVSGFHQFSLLVPASMLKDTLTIPDRASLLKPDSAAEQVLESYYTSRADESNAKLEHLVNAIAQAGGRASARMLAPPPICLESTFPVSTRLIGASVYSMTCERDSVNVKLLEAEINASAIARPLRGFSHGNFNNSVSASVKAKDLHPLKIVAGHLLDGADGNTRAGTRIAVRRFPLDSGQYSTVFYRHACHSINVTLIEKLGESGIPLHERGALSYQTWMNGRDDRFGVPVEDILMGTLPSNHPHVRNNRLGPNARHYLVHPFVRKHNPRIDAEFKSIREINKEIASLLDMSGFVNHLPPVLFGTTPVYPRADFYSFTGSKTLQQDLSISLDTFALRILNTRALMIEGGSASGNAEILARFVDTVSKFENVASSIHQNIKLFEIFGDWVTFGATQTKL